MEINLPPKIFMLFSYEVHVIECIEILAGYYILRPNLTLASISFLVSIFIILSYMWKCKLLSNFKCKISNMTSLLDLG
jgi:hypothetical protein